MKVKRMISKKCWLLKTEPSEYSIDDLAKGKTGGRPALRKTPGRGRWDGVRNYQARNFLRDSMRAGDLVIIYHSSIKEPAAVGTGEIVGKPYADPSQFDPKSPYFDPKASKSNPRWVSRDLKFTKKFKNPVTLSKMRQNSKLGGMVLLQKGSRLSVQPVGLPNFEEIVRMGN